MYLFLEIFRIIVTINDKSINSILFMKTLIINPTKFSPKINFDPDNHSFEISGQIFPENASKFFSPLCNWLNEFFREVESQNKNLKANPIKFKFKLTYLNSASTRCIYDLLVEIKKNCPTKDYLIIDWYFEAYDEAINEVGEDLSEMIKLPFNFVEI